MSRKLILPLSVVLWLYAAWVTAAPLPKHRQIANALLDDIDQATWVSQGGGNRVSAATEAWPVTEADLTVNAYLETVLKGARPDYGWLSEETRDDATRLERDRVWIVDPMDGTREFVMKVPDFEEKKLFGGIGYLIHGNMACGVIEEDLIVRVGAEAYNDLLSQPHTRPFDFTGRPMKGWVMVNFNADENTDETTLKTWVQRGVDFATTLPAK